MGNFGPDAAEAVPKLIELLRTDIYPDVRKYAAFSLSKIGEAAYPAIPALREALSDAEAIVRIEAAYALFILDSGSLEGLDVITTELKINADGSVRQNAAWALNEMGIDAHDAVPVLIDALKDRSYRVLLFSISALGRMGHYAADALPALRELVENIPEHLRSPSDREEFIDLVSETIETIENALTTEHENHQAKGRIK